MLTTAPWQAKGPGSLLLTSMRSVISASLAQPALSSTWRHSAAVSAGSLNRGRISKGFQAQVGIANKLPRANNALQTERRHLALALLRASINSTFSLILAQAPKGSGIVLPFAWTNVLSQPGGDGGANRWLAETPSQRE